jgi:glutamate-ammonia-ligase adenylyltransferase
MVTGLEQALRYYRHSAHDWELQALLKLRVCAGSRELGRSFIAQAEELIYGAAPSIEAVHTAARSLDKIRRGSSRRLSGGLDVKSGPGGLREIEFAAQCLQRVHGGGEPWLRSSSTLFAMQKLHDKRHIGDAEFRELAATYTLLRTIEHRLQCWQGAQAHRLPNSPDEQLSLLRSLPPPAPASVEELEADMRSASSLCARVLRLSEAEGQSAPSALNLGTPGAESLIRDFAARSPQIAHAFSAGPGDPTRRNLLRFLSAAATGEQRSQAALGNILLVERSLPLFTHSALATSLLSCYPADIAALFGSLALPESAALADRLRIAMRRALLSLLGQTVIESLPVWDVLRRYSSALESILAEALSACSPPPGVAVFALGRLATAELDVVSDADLLFVRSPECPSDEASRCVLALVSMLTSYTREGSVIAVDTRLRPHGASGELVVSSRQLLQYCRTEAISWDVAAFSKLRLVAGDASLQPDVALAVSELRQRFNAAPGFVPELRSMRQRLVGVASAAAAGASNFKTGPGGLYDMDFILALLESRALLPSAGRQWPERLAALASAGLLSGSQYEQLLHASDLFRRADHAIRVVEGRSRKWLPSSDTPRRSVLHLASAPTLEDELSAAMGQLRAIFDHFFPL